MLSEAPKVLVPQKDGLATRLFAASFARINELIFCRFPARITLTSV